MFEQFVKAVFGTKNQREIKRLLPLVEKINALECDYQKLSDDELKAKTPALKKRYQDGQKLDALLPEAFATVKNACRRMTEAKYPCTVRGQSIVWEMIPFDVQLIGGMVLHSGRIAEMGTGEGKTLVATLPTYLNALTGKGLHVVTVNDYLAARDSEWMGELYRYLGLTVGCIQNHMHPQLRKAAYECDITYGTSAEMGFDYLRDNGTAQSKEAQVQRGHIFALVDEVDSVLIDEARVPLIIAGQAAVSTHQYDKLKPLIERLVSAQNNEANRWASEAKKLLDTGKEEKMDDVGRLLFKVKNSMPHNRIFMRMIEEPSVRRSVDAAELRLYQDPRKTDLYNLKAEAYFSIDDKNSSADLSEKGREFLNPNDPEYFVLPDLITRFHDIDQNPKLSKEEKERAKVQEQQNYDSASERIHNIAQLLRAYCVYEKDQHYIVQEGKVIIVDEATGRGMPGRRWSDGLHQAVEAKENVQIDHETQTVATITIQNYFRLYRKLAGMTGTAETEANEFHDIYKLDVVVIPTNRPIKRVDLDDSLYKTRREKYSAIVAEIKLAHGIGQPILVGTASVETSELISRMLRRENIVHNVLNAKYIQQEAEIVAGAGQKGAVTIATNMAGRGTDIKLGSGVSQILGLYVANEKNKAVEKFGPETVIQETERRTSGLYVIGTERHESRRVDRQLRGRCARQGDPGLSKFFICFEDDLMRNFGDSKKMADLMSRMGMKDDEDMQHSWFNSIVENAQKQVETRNYIRRKQVLQYDDVMNQHRTVIYTIRNEILHTENPREIIFETITNVINAEAQSRLVGQDANPASYVAWLNQGFPLGVDEMDLPLDKGYKVVAEDSIKKVREAYELKIKYEVASAVPEIERMILLTSLDATWKEHLYSMDHLRNSINLRAIGQKDPLQEYKQEAYTMFGEVMTRIDAAVCTSLFRTSSNITAYMNFLANLPRQEIHNLPTSGFQLAPGEGPPAELSPIQKPMEAPRMEPEKERRGAPSSSSSATATAPAKAPEQPKPRQLPIRHSGPALSRNDPCPMGLGKKFKNCCGADGVTKQCIKQ